MRDIKFRGVTPTGCWVKGSLIYHGEQPQIQYVTRRHPDDGRVLDTDWAYVDPETVGQYTGLHDKNGKEIYENDIVEWQQYGFTGQKTDTIKGVVYFDTECGAYGLNTGFVEDFTWLEIFYNEVDLGDIAVIGNIHDNPELLKK